MDEGNPVLWYRKFKPVGKVRRRVQDLRIPSSSHYIISGPRLDLSHNESSRLAVDHLLTQGLEEYHKVLKAEGEVDFLSEMEKNYILKRGKDRSTGESDDLSADCQSCSSCSAGSTDRNSTLEGLEQNSVKDVKLADPLPDNPSVKVFFQSDSRAAGVKDLIRQFLRKAKLDLAIVMDSFSDPELLCDLLEASRKRNVSVHLLLDHLNLNLFVSMWQDLKLNSKNFPKLSVRSAHGQTYCAKTGRKLTGQIAESFIIADRTEVLTGSYSFTWLSGQVHHNLAVLIRGKSASHFHEEFHRLYSSSEPVPGFVTLMTVPQSFCHKSSSHKDQNENIVSRNGSMQTRTACLWARSKEAEKTHTKTPVKALHEPQSLDVDCSKGGNQPVKRKDAGSHTHRKNLQLIQKPLYKLEANCNLQCETVGHPQHTVVCIQFDARSNMERNQDQIHCQSDPPDQTLMSAVWSQPAGTTVISKIEKSLSIQKSNPLQNISPTHGQLRTVHDQSSLKKKNNRDHPDLITEGTFRQQMNRNLSVKPSVFSSSISTQVDHWKYALNIYTKTELPCNSPKLLYPSQQSQIKTSLQFPFTNTRGHMSMLQTKISSLQTNRQDQPPFLSHYNTKFSRSQSAPTGIRTHLKPQLQTDSKLFLPGVRAKMQQTYFPPRPNWIPQKHPAAGPRAVSCHNSFSAALAEGQVDWRPRQTRMNTLLGRSKSLTERHAAGFKGGLPLN